MITQDDLSDTEIVRTTQAVESSIAAAVPTEISDADLLQATQEVERHDLAEKADAPQLTKKIGFNSTKMIHTRN